MSELFMSQKSVKNPAMSIPVSAIVELYPERNGAIARESPIITTHERVRRVRTLELIFCTIEESSLYFESSRTVMV